MSATHLECDVLVIGCGAAGLRAAIAARDKGCNVVVLSKGSPGKGTSTLLSGGVFAGSKEGSPFETHRDQTLQAGRGINERALVDILVAEAPTRLRELVEWGIVGEMRDGYLFSSGPPPVWGEAIIRCLVGKAKDMGIRFLSHALVADLGFQDQAGVALVYESSQNRWRAVLARAVVLATGGAGALYARHDNPQGMLGEGYALALDAGAVLQDMEFVQFYPLGLFEPNAIPFLIAPRLADRGRLVNDRGEAILEKYQIRERPAAARARDRLAQALFLEIYRNDGKVRLDLTEVTEEQWCKDPLSASTREILRERFGAKTRPLLVAPMAHHVMGGVRIDPQGATSLQGLFAAGEVTGGLHGANRMGGNALSETLVFGARAGEGAAARSKGGALGGFHKDLKDLVHLPFSSRSRPSPRSPTRLKRRLQETLWMDGGILRNREGLLRAGRTIQEIREEALALPMDGPPRTVREAVCLRLATRTAGLILEAGLRREESRGAHFREDFPATDDEKWRGHLEVGRSSDGKEIWRFRGA